MYTWCIITLTTYSFLALAAVALDVVVLAVVDS